MRRKKNYLKMIISSHIIKSNDLLNGKCDKIISSLKDDEPTLEKKF